MAFLWRKMKNIRPLFSEPLSPVSKIDVLEKSKDTGYFNIKPTSEIPKKLRQETTLLSAPSQK